MRCDTRGDSETAMSRVCVVHISIFVHRVCACVRSIKSAFTGHERRTVQSTECKKQNRREFGAESLVQELSFNESFSCAHGRAVG